MSDLLGVAAVLSLLPGLAQAQTAQPVAPPAPTNPPAAAAFAPPPAAAPPAATPVAPGPPAAAPAPVAPAPAAGPVQLQPIAAAPGPIQLAPPGGGEAKAPEPRRIIDPHAAIKSSPFMDATLAGMWLEQRFGDPIVFGLQGGAYLAQTVRLVLRIEMPSKNATDEFRTQDDDPGLSSPAYFPRNSKAASLLYGASLGVVAASGEGFVFAPGLALQRSDVEDYGTMLGIAMPFEWVTTRGLRFGMEVDLGRAFGGTVHYTCSQSCPDGPTFDGHRGAGRAFALRFQMGFGFNHPR